MSVRVTGSATDALAAGFARIRQENGLPEMFPPDVLDAAKAAVALSPTMHLDRTTLPFVTLDPATSTDLDQAFCLETAGDNIVLRYAIADVGWFVRPDDALDREAWRRGTTMYLPDGRVSLYPSQLSEGAASLLPDGPRPAVVFTVRVDGDGRPTLDGVERAIIRSTAKLAYETATAADLPSQLPEFAARMSRADAARGAMRVELPEQEVQRAAQGFRLEFRPPREVEDWNSSLSLATNLAVAAALMAAHTGLFRVMSEAEPRAMARLRHTARALGVAWADDEPLSTVEQRLDAHVPRDAAFATAIRRAEGGASYVPYRDGVTPWHAAVAATYVHATAPLRRLADRYVVLAALAVAKGEAVPEAVRLAFERLPEVMERADSTGHRLDRAAIDLVEAVVLHGREGQTFPAVVTDVDERGARIQLCDEAVVARVNVRGAEPGDSLRVRLVSASPEARAVLFERVA